jgi:hypothetical protein
MKLVYSTLYKKTKDQIISLYSCFHDYFDDVEALIQKDPLASREELILFQGKHIHVRKRYIKTTFFSGLLPDSYLYLTLTYAITTDDQIVLILANLHDFID